MKHRIVWVHGIGDHRAGFSKPWQKVFDPFLKLGPEGYVEVLWEPVMEGRPPGARGAAVPIRLTPEERAAERRIRAELEARLAQRAAVEASAAPGARGAGRPVEWSRLRGRTPRGLLDVILNPGESIGDFARYLASRRLRLAVKECFKIEMRKLHDQGAAISVISHSWGTVVAHDSLVDLASELPGLKVANLFTLGSPLWLVRMLLEERSGRRPASLGHWTNIHAKGDLVGSWLKPAFAVHRDYEVPSHGRGDAHSSYFASGNEAVQHDLIARRILGR